MAVQIRTPRAVQGALLPAAPRGWIIAVEGPIGVGKTTLARRLAARFGAELLLEVVEDNPFLASFYQDIRGLALHTQLFFLLSRHRQQQAASARLAAGSRIVADYMFAKDRLFASLTLSGAELALYEAVYNLVAPHAPRPAAVVHLRAALPTLLQRIAARARPFERDLRPEYLERLAAAYDAFFETYDQAPVITVDTDRLELRDESSVAAVAAVVTDACQTPVGGIPVPPDGGAG